MWSHRLEGPSKRKRDDHGGRGQGDGRRATSSEMQEPPEAGGDEETRFSPEAPAGTSPARHFILLDAGAVQPSVCCYKLLGLCSFGKAAMGNACRLHGCLGMNE